MAAYKVAAEGGNPQYQWEVGYMYCNGLGVDVDHKQAVPWLKKAAAQDYVAAVSTLGSYYFAGNGVASSWRRAREYTERAIKLGSTFAPHNLRTLEQSIQNVTGKAKNFIFHPAPSSTT